MFGTRIDEYMDLKNAWKQYSSKIKELIDMACRFVKKEEMLDNAESAYILAKSKELCDESMIIGDLTVKQILKIDDVEKKLGRMEDTEARRYASLAKSFEDFEETQKEILKKLDLILEKRNDKKIEKN